MNVEVLLKREPNSSGTALRLYVWSNGSIVNDFPDTEEGMTQARECYTKTIQEVRQTGQTGQVLAKEIITLEEK
jgi:hypothetical protein